MAKTQVPLISIAASPVQQSYADVVSRIAPAVVTVRSTERTRTGQQVPFLEDPLFREFFGDRLPQQPRRVEGVASGVIVSADGYILTNHHVVDGATEIRVETSDNRSFTAKLVGSDQPSDLAVLKVEGANLPVIVLGDSDKVRVGDVVLAVGNPLGIGQTVTSGIISAKGRSTGLSDGSFEDFLQTDASINRGNSGGALVDTNGQLVGINSQILSPSGGSIGIGFAIPSNMAKAVMDQLLKTGRVRRGMIGVNIQPVTADVAASLSLPVARGAIVSAVQPGGPGERAGIRRGDVITAVNGQQITDHNNLRNVVASTAPGTNVMVTVLREGREQRIPVTLAELPSTTVSTAGEGGGGSGTGDKYGLTLEPLTAEMASRLGLSPSEQGLVVGRITPTGAATEAGMRQGDLIQEVNGQPVRTVAEFEGAIQRSGQRPALVLINRRGSPIFLTLRATP
ncbi:MAG TPA: DegQ family serine endoprotease [Pyrinomonadaceae bacterium]|nr:DegQ family serine endoprotease [Pyrinomonadaceae bacterium]